MSLTDIDDLENNPIEGDYQVTYHGQIHRGMKALKTLEQSTDTAVMKTAGTQTIAGIKTFNDSPVVPTPASSTDFANKLYADTGASGKEPALTAGTNAQYYRGDKTWQTLDKTAAGLANVDNTSDANKPVSTAQQTALNTKQNSLGTGTNSQYLRGDKSWQTLDKSAIGLANVDNTSDANKPVSTATQTALNLKQDSIATGETYQYFRGDKTWQTLNKSAAGLANVDNTSDADKPVSTATQTALDSKANSADTLLLTGAQTIAGTKTYSSSPKLGGTAVVGQVLKATSSDGLSDWEDIGPLVTTVDWDNIPDKPLTFAPTIGTTSTTAAAGDHTHTKSDIGLGNVDNTSDLAKPISTATQSELNTKVATSRTLSTSSHFTGGGDMSADRTYAFASGGIGLADMADATKKVGIAYVQTLDTRAVGLGQVEDGFECQFPLTITSVKYRMGTADASGTTTCEIRKNGVAVSGTSGTASTSPTAVTGTWSFSTGDKLTIYTTAIGTTPGKRLTADMIAIMA